MSDEDMPRRILALQNDAETMKRKAKALIAAMRELHEEVDRQRERHEEEGLAGTAAELADASALLDAMSDKLEALSISLFSAFYQRARGK